MVKLKQGRAALCLFVLSFLALGGGYSGVARANANTSWLNSPLYLSKVADVDAVRIPPTFFNGGNIDCSFTYGNNCSLSTAYGEVYDSSLWSGGKYRPIVDFGNNRANFVAIPASDTALTFFSSPTFGVFANYTNNISGSLAPKYITQTGGSGISGLDNLILDRFQLNRPPDGKIADRAGNRLAIDLNSLGFSANSRWMLVTSPNRATLRVDLASGAVLPFGQALTYGNGLNPAPKNAITSDGRYAAVAARDTSAFSVYDLGTCGSVPDNIAGPVSCQGRELLNSNFIGSRIPGFNGVQYMRFLDNDSLVFYASYKVGSQTQYAQYTLSINSGPVSRLQYLALGDSYISGEGAFIYQGNTDTDTNRCHLSLLAYPALMGRDLNYDSYNSVACSGASTDDVINANLTYIGQADRAQKLTRKALDETGLTGDYLSLFTPGHLNQLEYVKNYRPKAITVMVGGNDMGFSKILTRCVIPRLENTCYSTYEDRLELIRLINNSVFPNLVKTYTKIKNALPADSRIYAIGYPQIAKPDGDCGVNVRLNAEELMFGQQLIAYLDTVIRQAANKAGVFYADTQTAMDGRKLCEAGPGGAAMNGLTAGNDRPSRFGGPIGNESYHPNPLGYQLLEKSILAATDSLQAPMPAANLNASPPSEAGLEILSAPKSGRVVKTTQYAPAMADDLIYKNAAANFNVSGASYSLPPNSSWQVELRSTPTSLGSFTTNANGSLSGQITVPATIPAGYHSLHILGTDVSGQAIDIYKYVYVAANPDDLDGNGVADNTQKCIGIEPAGLDFDQDGIDDGCDGFIDKSPPPAAVTLGNISGSPTQTVNAAHAPTAPAATPPLAATSRNINIEGSQTYPGGIVSYSEPQASGTESEDEDGMVLGASVSKDTPRKWSFIIAVIVALGLAGSCYFVLKRRQAPS